MQPDLSFLLLLLLVLLLLVLTTAAKVQHQAIKRHQVVP
jgi:hypothetical protein